MHTSSSDLADHGPVLGFVQAEAPDWGSYFRKAQRVVEGGQEDYRATVEAVFFYVALIDGFSFKG